MLPETQDFVTHFSRRYPEVTVSVAGYTVPDVEFFSKFERWMKVELEKAHRSSYATLIPQMGVSLPIIVLVREVIAYKEVKVPSVDYPTKIENTGAAEKLSEILEYPVLPSEAKKPENNEVLLILK